LQGLGRYAEARAAYQEALAIRLTLEDRRGQAIIWNNLGNLAREERKYEEALTHFAKMAELNETLKIEYVHVVMLAGQASALAALGKDQEAIAIARELETLLSKHTCPDPYSLWFSCALAYKGGGLEAEAKHALSQAYAALMECAARIKDKRFRTSFLKNNRENQEIIQAYKRGRRSRT
jgi:tetratricopeptide (TPR) repeat protein